MSSSLKNPPKLGSDSATEAIQTRAAGDSNAMLKPKRKCTPAQLECLARNREKALEVIRTKGEKARLAKELKDRYKQHVDTERDAEIERMQDSTGRNKPEASVKGPSNAKRAPSPSESEESESSPSPSARQAQGQENASEAPPSYSQRYILIRIGLPAGQCRPKG